MINLGHSVSYMCVSIATGERDFFNQELAERHSSIYFNLLYYPQLKDGK